MSYNTTTTLPIPTAAAAGAGASSPRSSISSGGGVVQNQVVKTLEAEMSREIGLIKRLGSWALTTLFVLLIVAFILGIIVGRSSAVL